MPDYLLKSDKGEQKFTLLVFALEEALHIQGRATITDVATGTKYEFQDGKPKVDLTSLT